MHQFGVDAGAEVDVADAAAEITYVELGLGDGGDADRLVVSADRISGVPTVGCTIARLSVLPSGSAPRSVHTSVVPPNRCRSIGSGRSFHSSSMSSRYCGLTPGRRSRGARKILPSPAFGAPFCVQYSRRRSKSMAMPTQWLRSRARPGRQPPAPPVGAAHYRRGCTTAPACPPDRTSTARPPRNRRRAVCRS